MKPLSLPLVVGLLFSAAPLLAAGDLPPAPIETFLAENCYDCHDDSTAKGGLNLLDVPFDLKDRNLYLRWLQVFGRVDKGEMPPENKRAGLSVGAIESFLGHLSQSLIAQQDNGRVAQGRAELRRLSRVEYANSLKDLLHLPHAELAEMLPPAGHQALFGDLPLTPIDEAEAVHGYQYRIDPEDPIGAAQELMLRFATQALRRPVRQEDLATPLVQVQERLADDQPFVEAMLAGYRALLTSPAFLLLDEPVGELDDWRLASRLSFFLTNSPPDRPLRQKAQRGELGDPEVLRAETERLLDDPKRVRFLEHFLGYWIKLHDISLTEPDGNLYPEYNALLGESMVEETHAYFGTMLDENLGAWHLVDSDFLTINQRTAELYGIPGVLGYETRKVRLPADSVRGGLITQGSLLKVTANGTTTSPVVRGTFLMERVLGDPPPPPPASVPAIEPDITGATTIREQLDKHREIASCAACHEKIDPPGFALESFDPMGAWREVYRASKEDGEQGVDLEFGGKPAQFKRGLPVDASGAFSEGERWTTVEGFRDRLRPLEPQIARHLVKELIAYGTGAPVELTDRPALDAMMANLEKDQYGMRSMIHEIVQSELFRNK